MIRVLAFTLALLIMPILQAQASILDIEEVKSPGGITAWLVEDHTVPVISLRFSFRGSGAVNDPADKQGLARLLSNTMDEGAGDLDSKAFQEKLNDLSIGISFSASRDDFGGEVKTLTRNKLEAFKLLALALTKPRFDQDAVERMRLANLSRIRSDMTDPEWMAARLMNEVLYKGHPYAMNSGGTLTSLTKITPDDLRTKVKGELTKDRLIISVAGDISAAELSGLLDQVFGSLGTTSTKPEVKDIDVPATSSTLYKKSIPQTVIQIALPGIDHKDKDYFAAQVMNFIFGGAGFGSRLMDVIREQRGLTYGIFSGLSGMDHANALTISTSTKNATVKELLDLTAQQIETFKTTSITAKELNDAKTFLNGSVPLDLTSTSSISGYMITFQTLGLPRNYLDIREAGIKAVTADDVRRVAARVLDPARMTTILVGEPENFVPTATVTTLPNVE